jgi:hypothetical protein
MFAFLPARWQASANKQGISAVPIMEVNVLMVLLKSSVLVLVWVLTWGVPFQGESQNQTQDPPHDLQDERVTFVKIGPLSVWEFGLEVTALTDTRNIQTYAPVPIDWPEQQVRIVDRRLGVDAAVSYENLAELAQVMQIGIPSLAQGQTSRSAVWVDLTRYNIVAPKVTDRLTVPKSLPKQLKGFIQESPFIEISHPKVKKFASSIELDPKAPAWESVEKIYDAVREHLPYEFDPEIRSLPHAIDAGKGDCEELTSLFIAVCRINKIPARAVWIPGHTYAEFYLLDSSGEGQWYPCQLAGSRLFGEMMEHRPILQKGDRFVVSQFKKPVRYVAPQLIADGNVRLDWLSQPIDPATGKKLETRLGDQIDQ